MKKILFLFTGLLFAIPVSGQSTATNFSSTDCNGVSHDLFTELDGGKVVVICWVMPCATCIGPALTTNNVVASFASGSCDVDYYLVDDYANTSCTVLANWANSNGITSCTKFSSSAISMNNYGGAGMPKVVVLGTNNHTVYYNSNNTVDPTALQNAITQACADIVSSVEEAGPELSFGMYPNPSSEFLTVSYENSVGKFFLEIFNYKGEVVLTKFKDDLNPDGNSMIINVAGFSSGLYFIRLSDGENSETKKFIKE